MLVVAVGVAELLVTLILPMGLAARLAFCELSVPIVVALNDDVRSLTPH